MDVAQKPQQGWFSLLRWRADTARDEARNVALLLVEERGGFNAFKAAPLSRISSRLQEQGLLDATLVALEQQFGPEQAFTLERLTSMHDKLHHSLYLTKPRPVAVQNLDETVGSSTKLSLLPEVAAGQATQRMLCSTALCRLTENRGSTCGGALTSMTLFSMPSFAEVRSEAWLRCCHSQLHGRTGRRSSGTPGTSFLPSGS